LYGFTDPDPSTSQTQWVRVNPATGNITALWSTPLPIEPYVAAIDEPRGLLYAVIMPETAQGQKFSLVALSLASGEAHFNVSLPYGAYPGSDHANTGEQGLRHSAGTHSGTQLDVDPKTGDVLVGGIVQEVVHWKPSSGCTPACNASLCCIDPEAGAAACFDRIHECADISEPAGSAYFRQFRLSSETKKFTEFEMPKTNWSKTGSSSLDAASRTLYVQLKLNAGAGPVTGVTPQYVYGYNIDTGKISHTINTTASVLALQNTDDSVFDFEDMNYDPHNKRLLSISLCVGKQFFRCLLSLDPLSGNITHLSPLYSDMQHNDRIGVDSVLDPVARVVYETLPTNTVELVGYSADTGKVVNDVNLTQLSLFPNNLELGS